MRALNGYCWGRRLILAREIRLHSDDVGANSELKYDQTVYIVADGSFKFRQ